MIRATVAAVVLFAVAGCAAGPELQGPIYRGSVMVLDDPYQYPHLCGTSRVVAQPDITPAPPDAADPDDPGTWRCHDIRLEGWSWKGLSGVRHSGRATWGYFWIEGTLDGNRFRVRRVAAPPAGQPTSFFDDTEPDTAPEGRCGGQWAAMCSTARTALVRLDRDLSAISDDLWDNSEDLGLVYDAGGVGIENHVDLHMVLMFPDAQRKLDERYGPGMVHPTANLVPSRR